MWTNQSCCARKDAVFMATRLGEASAQSAGERRIKKKNKSKFRKTGLLLRGVSFLHRCPPSVHLPDVTAVIHVSRLQREEEEAYASRQQKAQPQPSITRFSKFEERKSKEKSSKVHTVTKFFTPSKTPPKKGISSARTACIVYNLNYLIIFKICFKV